LLNEGAHDATNVTVQLTTKPSAETYVDHAEIEVIAAGQPYKLTFPTLTFFSALPFTLEIEWSDGRPGRQHRKMEVNTAEG